MKKFLIPFVLVSLLAACSSPVLKWIDTPSSGNGRMVGQPDAKEIVSFSFGIDGETDLPFGKDHDISGKIPIRIILPMGSGLNPLMPTITFIGKSLVPSSGEPRDFSSPVVYTVTAEDDSALDYSVKVYAKGPSTKEIVRFALDVSQSGSSAISAEGTINEDKNEILVTVPAGTNLNALTAHVTHTGVEALDPLSGLHFDETFTFTGDFSSLSTWTVIAQDHSDKIYTVRVIKQKDSTKEITAFSLGFSGETDIIGGEPQPDGKYPIVVVVPEDKSTKVFPNIMYQGASISPSPDTERDFSSPAAYTVTAEDGSIREYVVKIVQKNSVAAGEKEITGFYFREPLVEGVIDQGDHTIALTVPAGTNLNGLRPEIYYRGASINPMSGQPRDFTKDPVIYTVRDQNRDSQEYEVSVFIAPAPPVVDVPGGSGGKVDVGVSADAASPGTDSGNYTVIVEFPVHIENPALNITYPAASTSDNDTINQILNQILLLQNKEQVYNHITNETINNYITESISTDVDVTIINPPPDNPPAPGSTEASIDGFYFTNPAAVGEIDQAAGTIRVTVPYGTDLRNLTAGICYTGKEIAGIPGSSPLKDTRSFTSPVNYTVKARDGVTSKNYQVTVTAALNNAKEITAFSFDGITGTTIISAMPNKSGKYPIEVTIPTPPVTDLTGLTAKITHTGVSISPSSGTVDYSNSKTSPVEYTVRAQNGGTRTYTVTVRYEADEDDPELLGFYFTNPLAVGVVNQNANTITVTVPSSANTKALVPAVYFKGISVTPASGAAKDFGSPVIYTVTGRTGKTRLYTVTVIPTPSSAKDITGFTFPGIGDGETVIGAVPNSDGTYPIAVWIPTGVSLGSLAPVITLTGGASVNPGGGIPQNFSGPQNYTVTAEDGTTKIYKVTVNPRNSGAKVITSFIFNEVPLVGGEVVRVAASIDQDGHSITATVPSNADVTALVPALTYIGRSIAEPPGGSDQTANPFTGAAQDFSSPKVYTVKDQEGGRQEYTVTVIKQSPIVVSFTGERDETVVKSKTVEPSGVITVTVNSEIKGPYEWYVDGVRQAVSGAADTFTLNAGNGSFTPGRHEIMVAGKKNGLHYTGKVTFDVSR